MPEGQDNELSGLHVVVDVVLDSIQLQAAKFWVTPRRAFIANSWLEGEQLDAFTKILRDGARRRRTIASPPFRRAFELCECSRSYLYDEHKTQ